MSGCTLLGAGIGAAIDSTIPGPYEAREPTERVHLVNGERVDLGLRSGKHVRGRYLGVHGPTNRDPETYLLVEAEGAVASVPSSELRVLGVEVTGKGWLYGGVVGLVLDVTVVVVAIIAVQNMKLDMHGALGDCIC